jgi:transposase
MTTTPPPLDFDHQKGFEIPTKHKEAIRQLHNFAKVPIPVLETRYKLGNSTIRRILAYDAPERARPTRIGRPQKLTDTQVDGIIEYCSETWDNRIMKYEVLCEELKLTCTPITLRQRLHQKGYYRCTAYQKPYLSIAQATARLLWAITHIFWHLE